jgi:hypothetical protein
MKLTHTPLCSPEVKNAWLCSATTAPHVIMVWYLIKSRHHFNLLYFTHTVFIVEQ